MPDISQIDPDLIAIQDAVEQYKLSMSWLFNHSYGDDEESSAERPLRRVKVPGDKRTFLRHSQIKAALRPSDYASGAQPTAE